MISPKNAFIALVAAMIMVFSVATTAQAYNTASYWNRSASPLIVNGYGSTAQAYGYIKIVNGGQGTRMHNYAWNKFKDADNHQAYIKAISQFNSGSCANVSAQVTFKGVKVGASTSCARVFYSRSNFPRSTGLSYTRSTWVAMPVTNVGVHPGADRGRAQVKLCIDIPLD